MAPDTWIPPVQVTQKHGSDSLMDKAVSIAVDFYGKYNKKRQNMTGLRTG